MTPVRTMSLEEVAETTGGRVLGESTLRIRDVAPLRDAGPDHLGLLADGRYLAAAAESRAGAFLVAESLAADAPTDRPRVVVGDPHRALIPLLPRLHPEPDPEPGVHPTAVLGRRVVLGGRVVVGPYAVLEDDVVLGDGARIGAHTVVGRECRVGEDAVLHPHVVLYPRTLVGRRVVVHAGAKLGVDGFGYAAVDGAFRKVPQVGRCVVEDDVEIGANTCIDRGSIGETVIGGGSKLDNLVHVGHNVRVGEDCALAGLVGIAGSTRIGRGVVFGGQSGAGGHVEIGDRVKVGARAGIIGDVASGESVTGFPARDVRRYMKGTAHMLRLPHLTRRVRDLERRLEGRLESSPDGEPGGGEAGTAVDGGGGEARGG